MQTPAERLRSLLENPDVESVLNSASSHQSVGLIRTLRSGAEARARRFRSRAIVVLASIALFGSSSAIGCSTDLAHLGDKLPKYASPRLAELRNYILGTNLLMFLQQMQSRGMTSVQITQAALQSAHQAELALESAKQCIHEISTRPDQTIQELEAGTFSGLDAGGMLASCAQAYVATYYSAIAAKEGSVQLACLARGT